MTSETRLFSLVSDDYLERLLREDVPYLDLTTCILDIGHRPAALEYFSREEAVVACTEEVKRIFEKLGATARSLVPSGERVAPGQALFRAEGTAEALHMGWKVGLNLLEHASAIATRTRKLVDLARSANPRASVVTTRKGIPGSKEYAVKAVLAGGGQPHRLGLSETVLVFEQHRNFLPPDAFPSLIGELRSRASEKKVLAEVDTLDQAVGLVRAGIDGIQFDKVEPETLRGWSATLRALNPNLVLIAAGGITDRNVQAYAAAGVETLASSWVYFGKPVDLGTSIMPL